MQIRSILLATDLSPASVAALPVAARMAWTYDAEVVVMTVAPRADFDAPGSATSRRLEAFRSSLAQMDVRARSLPVEGARSDAGRLIGEHLRAESMDLVVLTRHGERAQAGSVGSVTTELARTAPVPVLVAHGPLSHNPSEVVKPATFERILVTTDFSEASTATAQRAAALAAELHARLHLLTVLVDARCPLDVADDHVAFADPPGDLTIWAEQTKQRLDALDLATPMEVSRRVVVADDAAVAIVAAALQDHIDLLVVAAGSRGPIETLLLGSTTEAVLRLSPLPVLVLRGR
jgi:nucleotide-binding universal stress UspA family protein